MQYILDLLNKIKYDKREKPEDYVLIYVDRVTRKKIKIKYTDIKRIEGTLIVLMRNDKEVHIPVHRIKEVKRKGVTVWKK